VSALASLFDPTRRDLKRAERLVEQTSALDERFQALTNELLAAQTSEFRRRLEEGETVDDLLPEAFAAVREAARRTVGERPFDVQVLGAIMLHQGKIAEMRTGEGKTLTATLALYLNGLTGRGAHLVTVNDYLARRDATWYGPIYRMLGFKVGVIQSGGGRGLPAYLYEPGYHEADGLEDLRPVPAAKPMPPMSSMAPTASSVSTTCATTWWSLPSSWCRASSTTRSWTRWTRSW